MRRRNSSRSRIFAWRLPVRGFFLFAASGRWSIAGPSTCSWPLPTRKAERRTTRRASSSRASSRTVCCSVRMAMVVGRTRSSRGSTRGLERLDRLVVCSDGVAPHLIVIALKFMFQQDYAHYFDRLALGLRWPFFMIGMTSRSRLRVRLWPGAAAATPDPWTVPTTTPSLRHAE